MRTTVILSLVIALCACVPCAHAAQPLTENDFVFTLGDATYPLGGPAAPLLAAAEDAIGPMSLWEADSCMFSGTDKEYENDELLLATYPIGPDGGDVLETVMVISGEHKTSRGIGIGDTLDAVIAAYGDAYTLDYDQLLYAQSDLSAGPMLVFVLDLETDLVASYYITLNTTP